MERWLNNSLYSIVILIMCHACMQGHLGAMGSKLFIYASKNRERQIWGDNSLLKLAD